MEPPVYVVWIRHSDYREDEHVNASLARPRDYRNSFGTVTFEVLLETPDWSVAHDRIEYERACQENAEFTKGKKEQMSNEKENLPDPGLGTYALTWTPPDRVTLLRAVRQIVAENPGRHDQSGWVGNVFDDGYSRNAVLGDVQALAMTPVPLAPLDAGNPVCGTAGCVAGWLGILGSDPRAVLRGSYVRLGGREEHVSGLAAKYAGLNPRQERYLFAVIRTREEILTALDALIEDKDAEICRNSSDPVEEALNRESPGEILARVEGFTCPDCGMTSRNPEDIRYRYCGSCHQYK
jgi:hypothetical protein